MAETVVKGYMLNLKWGTKLIKGLITTGLKIKPNYEEVLLKSSSGVPVDEFIDFDTEFTGSGQTIERDTGESSTHEDFETLREAASVGATVAFVYGRFTTGEKIVSGNAKIQDYSEDANSKDRGSYTVSFKAVRGSVTFGTYT